MSKGILEARMKTTMLYKKYLTVKEVIHRNKVYLLPLSFITGKSQILTPFLHQEVIFFQPDGNKLYVLHWHSGNYKINLK